MTFPEPHVANVSRSDPSVLLLEAVLLAVGGFLAYKVDFGASTA